MNPKKRSWTRLSSYSRELEVLKDQEKTLQESGRSRLSPTDPDARLMKSHEGMIPAYNLKRLMNIELVEDLREMIGNYEWAIA